MARRRAATRLVHSAAAQPAAAATVADDIVAGLAHETLRPDAMRALFHATRRANPDVDPVAVAEYVDAGDPTVRGDAVAVLGAVVSLRAADAPQADAIVDAIGDSDTAVQQTALGVFDTFSSDELAEAPLGRLHGLVEAVFPLSEDDGPTVRARAASLAETVTQAVMGRVVEHALGIDNQWTAGSVAPERAGDILVAAAVADSAFARWAANTLAYRASTSSGVDESRVEALLQRVVDRSDAFDTVADLREAASGDEAPADGTVRQLTADMANT